MSKQQSSVSILEQKSRKYEDIIHLPHPVSTEHPQMSIHDRAAQFSPFAALTGFEGEIKETARLTNQKIELDEDTKLLLDEKLKEIQENILHRNKRLELEKYNSVDIREYNSVDADNRWRELTNTTYGICYFQSDSKKNGGTYVTEYGSIKKIDNFEHLLIMENGIRIPMDDIIEITKCE